MCALTPFAEAKTIRDIGSYLPVALGGQPDDPAEHSRAATQWLERSQASLPPSVANPEYFNDWMGDSTLLALEFAPTFVRLTVDLDDAQVFARELARILDIPRRWSPCPVDLVMHDPSFIRSITHDEAGNLHDLDFESQSSTDERGIGVLLNEWFFQRDDGLGWVTQIYDWQPPGIHLLVECTHASAIDRRLDALTESFGPAVVPLWLDAVSQSENGTGARRFWIGEDLEPRLRDQIATRNLSRLDFQPQ